MKDITLAQEFLLCAMNKKGKLSGLDGRCVPTLTAAAVVELLQAGVLQIDDKKASVLCPLPDDVAHLRQMYAYIEKKQPVTLENIVGHFNASFSQKAEKNLFADVKQALAENGCLLEMEQKTLLGDEKTLLVPDAACVDAVVQKIRAELLESGPLDDATIALTALLAKAQILKQYFSKYEADTLKQRLKEIQADPNYALVAQILDYFESIIVVAVIAAT